MLLNIILTIALFTALGHIAYKTMNEYVSIPIRALIGCAGYGISQFILDIMDMLSIGFGWMLLASVACSCVLILILRMLKRLLYVETLWDYNDSTTTNAEITRLFDACYNRKKEEIEAAFDAAIEEFERRGSEEPVLVFC